LSQLIVTLVAKQFFDLNFLNLNIFFSCQLQYLCHYILVINLFI
jgi:hypothetical protein